MTNFTRLSRLLINVGTHALKSTFDAIHSPADLHTVLHQQHVHDALKKLRTKRIVTTAQWNNLYPVAGPVTSAGFDITLLSLLLRKICGLTAPAVTGWDKQPRVADISKEADLVRIKCYRNTIYGHITETVVEDNDFETLWSDIAEALIRMGGAQYKTIIEKLKLEAIDPMDEEYYRNLLLDWEEYDKTLMEELQEIKSLLKKAKGRNALNAEGCDELNLLKQDKHDLSEFLTFSSTYDGRTKLDESITDYIIENPEQVLIVIDGFDEFNYQESIYGDSETQFSNDPRTEMPVSAMCSKLIKGKILGDSVVMVTSRPGDANEIKEKLKFDRYVEITGFNDQHVTEYVEKYFRDSEETKNKVLESLNGNSNLFSFAHIPLLCFLLCNYMKWYIDEFCEDNPITLTEFYSRIIHYIEENHNKVLHREDLKDEYDSEKSLDILSELAAKLIVHNMHSFDEKDLKDLHLSDQQTAYLKASSLICSGPGVRDRPFGKMTTEFVFTHYTFQEYLAARSFAKKKDIPVEKIGSEMVLPFTAGLLSGVKDADKVMELLLERIARKAASEKTLVLIKCLYEYGDVNFTKRVIRNNQEQYWESSGRFAFEAPRSVSTAFERSIRTLSKTKVFTEPYSVPYYYGPERQNTRYKSTPIDPEKTYNNTAKLLLQDYDGINLVFTKNMAYHVSKKFDMFLSKEFQGTRHTFLIRDPAKSIASLYRLSTDRNESGWDYFEPEDSGVRQLYEFYTFVTEHLDPNPVVIDADDLLDDADGMMKKYCEAVGISYEPHMTTWQAGMMDGWTSWPKGWFNSVSQSTGFEKRSATKSVSEAKEKHPEEVAKAIEDLRPFYALLYAKRMI
ncbi:hypothetical protein QZH41_000005 [Actinostola sp. cb2023]|nr:hypothetical protein QZH41_000005 [Actinostola sp. cb2023]